MTLLTVNAGSTSVKLALFDLDEKHRLSQDRIESHASNEDPRAVLDALKRSGSHAISAIAHRVVHGGDRFAHPTVLDAPAVVAIEELATLAPLHNHAALGWIKAARELWPEAPQVAAFDTTLFRALPRVAAEYALPAHLGTEIGVRRYGFHGLAHQAMLDGWCLLYPELERGGRVITLQLGGGCSVTAFDCGRPIDTSMGFSPLEGLVMATRSGDLDPAVIPYLQKKRGLSAEQIIRELNENAGLAGVSGVSEDPSALLRHPSPQARFAVELYCYRIRKFIGSYLAALGGCDGIVFGGGVGEHAPGVRSRALHDMQWAGIQIDPVFNEIADGGHAIISAAESSVKVHVVVVDEASALARAAVDLLGRFLEPSSVQELSA
jgi:acetate kinase